MWNCLQQTSTNAATNITAPLGDLVWGLGFAIFTITARHGCCVPTPPSTTFMIRWQFLIMSRLELEMSAQKRSATQMKLHSSLCNNKSNKSSNNSISEHRLPLPELSAASQQWRSTVRSKCQLSLLKIACKKFIFAYESVARWSAGNAGELEIICCYYE